MGEDRDPVDPNPIGPARARERWRECGLGAAGVCAGCWRSGCRVTREIAEERAAFRAGYVGPPLTDEQVDEAIARALPVPRRELADPLLEMERAEGESLSRLGDGPCSGCGVAPLRNGRHRSGCPALLDRAVAGARAEIEADWHRWAPLPLDPPAEYHADGDPPPEVLAACRRISRGLHADRERAFFGWQLPKLGRYRSIRRRLRSQLLWRACWLALSLAAISAGITLAAWH